MSNSQEPFLALNLRVTHRFDLQRDSFATASRSCRDWIGGWAVDGQSNFLLVLSTIDCHLAVGQFPGIVRKLR
jgi:hypothetical protein